MRLRLRVLLIAALLAISAATALATTVRLRGRIGSVAFTGNGTATSPDFEPAADSPRITTFTNAPRAGTVQVFRIDAAGVAHSQGAAVALANCVAGPPAACDEDVQVFDYSWDGHVRVVYTNTSNNAGTATFDISDARPPRGQR